MFQTNKHTDSYFINIDYKNSCLGYLNALQSGDESVINSGLNNLPEFAVLCQVTLRGSPRFKRTEETL